MEEVDSDSLAADTNQACARARTHVCVRLPCVHVMLDKSVSVLHPVLR